MLVVREFEFFESENCIVVFPCEGLGATQGEDLQDAIEFAADWLYWTVIYDMTKSRSRSSSWDMSHSMEASLFRSPLIAVLRALKHSPLQKQLVFWV